MPSRAESRAGIEITLRSISLSILAWMLWMSLDRPRPETKVSAKSASLSAGLRSWSRLAITPEVVAVDLTRIPTRLERDWLHALGGAGSTVGWTGDLPAVGVSVQPIAAPRGGWTVEAAAPAKSTVTIRDDVGILDSAVAADGGARFAVPSATGNIEASVGGSTANFSLGDSISLKRLLVLGRAGWEAKFVVAALEEDGWQVDAEFAVAPGAEVTQGRPASIDTSRYSAVIALDGSAASRASEIGRYVMSGGGLVLAGAASELDAFSQIRPGVPGRLRGQSGLESDQSPVTLAALPFVPITALRADGIALARQQGFIATAARRHGAGRVVQQGYIDTWRWRMSGGDDSPRDHRAWWTRAVAGVAYAPVAGSAVSGVTDPAPYAALVESLGEKSQSTSPALTTSRSAISLWWLFALLSFCLLAEWGSRRWRGLR